MASSTTIVKPIIFREYIGSKPYPDNLPDFPHTIIPENKEFHFIIAFASETYDESGRGTGMFYRNWIVPPIDGEMIQRLKNRYEKVKVIISIGGRGIKYPFNPAASETWPDIASTSLIQIINDLEGPIDGIDIYYDTIISGDKDVFTSCIGRLINILKKKNPLVISIAPSFSVDGHYVALYRAHGNDIDWVNYQFYTGPPITSVDEFVKRYRQVANEEYPGHKLLAEFSTDPSDAGHLSPEVFIVGCVVLIETGELPGIFFWDAIDSFPMEREARNLLALN